MKATEIWKSILVIAYAFVATFDFLLIIGEDTNNETSIGYFFMIKILALVAGVGLYTIGKFIKEKGLLPKWFISLTKMEEQV